MQETAERHEAAFADPYPRDSFWYLPSGRLAVVTAHGCYVHLRYVDEEGGAVMLRREVMLKAREA